MLVSAGAAKSSVAQRLQFGMIAVRGRKTRSVTVTVAPRDTVLALAFSPVRSLALAFENAQRNRDSPAGPMRQSESVAWTATL
jgi:hypothetical protein